MTRVWRQVDRHFEEAVCGVLLVCLMLLLGVQVVLRYGFGASISWHEEATRLLFVWFAYLGASLGVQREGHIRVTSFVQLLPAPWLRHAAVMVADALWLAFNLTVIVVAQDFFALSWQFRQASAALGIDTFWIQLIVPIGFALMSLRLVQLYAQWLRGRRAAPSMAELDDPGGPAHAVREGPGA